MIRKARVTALVRNVITDKDIQSAWKQLGKCGQLGVDAILDALEGKHGPPPKGRHPFDVHDNLLGGLYAIARMNPEPLLSTLERRPRHASSLIWVLGSSRNKLVMETLVKYSKHKDMWVRWSAVEGLGRCRRKSLRQPLLDALRDRSDMVRFSALIGLAKIADRTAIEPLKHYLAAKRLSPGGNRIATELLAKLQNAQH